MHEEQQAWGRVCRGGDTDQEECTANALQGQKGQEGCVGWGNLSKQLVTFPAASPLLILLASFQKSKTLLLGSCQGVLEMTPADYGSVGNVPK